MTTKYYFQIVQYSTDQWNLTVVKMTEEKCIFVTKCSSLFDKNDGIIGKPIWCISTFNWCISMYLVYNYLSIISDRTKMWKGNYNFTMEIASALDCCWKGKRSPVCNTFHFFHLLLFTISFLYLGCDLYAWLNPWFFMNTHKYKVQ